MAPTSPTRIVDFCTTNTALATVWVLEGAIRWHANINVFKIYSHSGSPHTQHRILRSSVFGIWSRWYLKGDKKDLLAAVIGIAHPAAGNVIDGWSRDGRRHGKDENSTSWWRLIKLEDSIFLIYPYKSVFIDHAILHTEFRPLYNRPVTCPISDDQADRKISGQHMSQDIRHKNLF